MNILLIGGCSSFTNNIITKLKKEGHRVYLLTGNRYEKRPYQKVFEQYNFPYDSNNLHEVFESINPDVTICMGAYDTNYHWDEDESESVKYSSNMMNIMMSYITGAHGKFIYLSSEEVYEDSNEENLTEEVRPTPKSFKSMALAQAEELCENYRINCGRDIVTLRLDQVYSMPDSLVDVTDRCTKMCVQACAKGTITVEENHNFSLLFASDAILYLYQVVVSGRHNHGIYNISSEETVSERELAEIIRANSKGDDIQIILKGGNYQKKVLSGERFRQEFKTSHLCDRDNTIAKIYQHIKKNPRIFIHGEDKKKNIRERLLDQAGWLMKVFVPFFENFLAFIVFFMLNNRAVGMKAFARLDFYLLYVLLFAIVYGQQQAIVSATLSVVGFCFRQMYDRSGFDLMLDSNTYIWIAQLFILGLAVGYMRDVITKMKREQESERDYLDMQIEDIRSINDSNVRVKDALELEVVNQNDSVGKIYSITSSLNQYSTEEVLFYAAEVIANLIKSKDIAIYSVSNDTYARLLSSTSDESRALGNSLRYKELGEMYDALAAKSVFINRKLDERYPMMANAIFDENDVMQDIVMIWTIPWERMTLGQANQLTVICALIRDAIVRADRYLEALVEERYVEDSKLLDSEAFATLTTAYINAQKRGLTQCMVLRLRENGEDDIVLSEKLAAILRDHDYIGRLEDNNLYILLSNASRNDALRVIDRLAERGYDSDILEDYYA